MNTNCDPEEIALKSGFLGPQAENAPWVSETFNHLLEKWFTWRRALYPQDGCAISEGDRGLEEFQRRQTRIREQLDLLMGRFETEIPKFSPRYIGHMFSETSLPALFGHVIALLHNPNNISGEASHVGIRIEDEAIESLFSMINLKHAGSGHFTSGGTIANFEALVRAKARTSLWLAAGAASQGLTLFESAHMGWQRFHSLKHPHDKIASFHLDDSNPWEAAAKLALAFNTPFLGPVILVPAHMHYSWSKGASLLGLGRDSLWPIQLDEKGRLSVSDLESKLHRARDQQRPVLIVVSVAGSTELGAFDPVDQVQDLLDSWERRFGHHIWHHVDAAFGGFFSTMSRDQRAQMGNGVHLALSALNRVNSVTLDPHKLGYVPYASGSILVRERRDYEVQGFNAPYVHFDLQKDRGPFTIEGSRSAAGALATWMIHQTIGLHPDGYGRILQRTCQAKRDLAGRLKESGLPIQIVPELDSNILCFTIARSGESLSQSNLRTEQVYDALSAAGGGEFFVSKTCLGSDRYGKFLDHFTQAWEPVRDCNEVSLIRLCMMNPFFSSRETRTDYAQEFVQALAKLILAKT